MKKSAAKAPKRITYIDTAKCILILLTLLGHVVISFRQLGNPHPTLLMLIYTFHMPAFFIITGVVFNTKKWLNASPIKFITSKFLTLIVPYIFLDITGGVLIMITSGSASLDGLLPIVKKTFSYLTNVGSTWFLPALFIANVLFYFFLRYYKKWFKYFAFLPVLLIGAKIIPSSPLYIFITRGIIGFTFMYIGYALKNYFLDDYNKRYDILIVAAVLLIMITKLNGQIDLRNSGVHNPIYMILGGIVGTFLTFGIAKHLDNKAFQFYGKNTIVVMATHSILILPLYHLLNLRPNNISLVLLFIIISALEIPIILVYNKLFPKLIGKKKWLKEKPGTAKKRTRKPTKN